MDRISINDDNNNINFREIAEKLWNLLDDIDTASDIFKPQNEKSAMAFYKYVMSKQTERHKYLKSDGYRLYTAEEFDQLPKSEPQFISIENQSIE